MKTFLGKLMPCLVLASFFCIISVATPPRGGIKPIRKIKSAPPSTRRATVQPPPARSQSLSGRPSAAPNVPAPRVETVPPPPTRRQTYSGRPAAPQTTQPATPGGRVQAPARRQSYSGRPTPANQAPVLAPTKVSANEERIRATEDLLRQRGHTQAEATPAPSTSPRPNQNTNQSTTPEARPTNQYSEYNAATNTFDGKSVNNKYGVLPKRKPPATAPNGGYQDMHLPLPEAKPSKGVTTNNPTSNYDKVEEDHLKSQSNAASKSNASAAGKNSQIQSKGSSKEQPAKVNHFSSSKGKSEPSKSNENNSQSNDKYNSKPSGKGEKVD